MSTTNSDNNKCSQLFDLPHLAGIFDHWKSSTGFGKYTSKSVLEYALGFCIKHECLTKIPELKIEREVCRDITKLDRFIHAGTVVIHDDDKRDPNLLSTITTTTERRNDYRSEYRIPQNCSTEETVSHIVNIISADIVHTERASIGQEPVMYHTLGNFDVTIQDTSEPNVYFVVTKYSSLILQ